MQGPPADHSSCQTEKRGARRLAMPVIPDSIRRQRSLTADLLSIPLDLIGVIDRRHQECELLVPGRGRWKVYIRRIHGDPRIPWMGCGAPFSIVVVLPP